MIIVCASCSARYKFDETKLGDRPSARTKCAKCGAAIDIENPLLGAMTLPPGTIPIERLLVDIRLLSIGVAELRPEDSAALISAIDETPIETRVRITSEEITELLTQETTVTEAPMTLLVKKPDYLGYSRWEFRHGDHPLEAKISDLEWLARFQEGRVALKPGDALRAVVRTEVARGFEGNIVDERHEVLKVLDVVPTTSAEQDKLL